VPIKAKILNNFYWGGPLMKMKQYFLYLSILMSSSVFSENIDRAILDQYPGLYFDVQSNLYFINDKISFSIHPDKNEKYLDNVQYSVDNGPFKNYSGNIKFDKDGFHIVRFKAVDPVLNWSPTQNFRIYVDLTHPTSSSEWFGKTYANGVDLFVSGEAKLQLSAQDNLSGVSKIVWAQDNTPGINIFQDGKSFKEGVHTIKIAAVDNVGNAEDWKQLNFTVDSTPPQSTVNIRGNTFARNAKSFIDKGSYVSLKAQDEISGVNRIEYRINNGPVKTFQHKIPIDNKISKIEYRSIDNVDNKENWKSLEVFLDSTPPKLAIENKGNYKQIAGKIYARSGFAIVANVSDDDSGAKSLFVNNSFENVTHKEIIFNQPGEHSIYLGAEDQVGNTANSVSYTVVIDEETPQTTLNTSNDFVQKGETFISSLPNKIDFTANDKGVGIAYIELSYNGKDFHKIQGPIDLATWTEDSRTIHFRSMDKLGNLEPVQKMHINVRNKGPIVDLYVEKDDMPKVSLSELIKNKNKMRLPASKKPAADK